ncbi:MAG TPA: DUF6152 family protein, partial [Steroidobacteraceae bacterium]
RARDRNVRFRAWIAYASVRVKKADREGRRYKLMSAATHYRRVLMGLAAASMAFQALAHHSAAMFDDDKSVTLSGTVRSFQWTNPHCFIQVLVSGDAGPVEWSVEMGSPSMLFRAGWKPGTLKAGDKITVVIHPVRDGTPGGRFVSATTVDGKRL